MRLAIFFVKVKLALLALVALTWRTSLTPSCCNACGLSAPWW